MHQDGRLNEDGVEARKMDGSSEQQRQNEVRRERHQQKREKKGRGNDSNESNKGQMTRGERYPRSFSRNLSTVTSTSDMEIICDDSK